MSIQTYSVDRFIGLNQSGDENLMSPACTPDAANMCTDGGELRVAYGFTRLFEAAVPGTLRIDFFTLYRTNGAEIPVVIAGGVVYAYMENAWTPVYTYQSTRSKPIYDCAQVRINTTDYLVIADGQHGMIKFDGSSVTQFGSEENASNIPVSFLTMYRGRLFAAGDAANPDRLYYSVLPGSGRTVEQWGAVEASPAVEGGHVEIGALGGDPIVAVRALSNQLLIFKKNSLYRLFGDRPSNYTVEHIDTEIPQTNHAAVAVYGDMLYFGTQNGLYYYNGVTARPCADMRCIKAYMATAEVSGCRIKIVRDRLYFTFRRSARDEMIEYDLLERRYMRRNGFELIDMAVSGSRLLFINSKRFVYLFNNGMDYDGEPINAFWCTPLTDLGAKAAVKNLRRLYLRGSGGTLKVTVEIDGNTYTCRKQLPDSCSKVTEIPLKNGGRCFRLKLSNEAGGSFTLRGGLELKIGIGKRVD